MQTFRDTFILRATQEQVFEYYTNLDNLTRMASSDVQMRVARAETPLRLGSRIRFILTHKAFPFEVGWDAEISKFEPHSLFEDRQVRGPFDHWVHRHQFRELSDGRTEVSDTIEVGAPMGVFGRIAERVLLGSRIEGMFRHRREIMRADLEDASVES